jgi:hypothetical protein
MQSWSSKGAYAKGRLSDQELDLRSLKHMDQEGKLLQLSFVETSQSEAGYWFKAIEA